MEPRAAAKLAMHAAGTGPFIRSSLGSQNIVGGQPVRRKLLAQGLL
jgi:hypothetical protein